MYASERNTNHGWAHLAKSDAGMRNGVNIAWEAVTHHAVAEAFGLPFLRWKRSSIRYSLWGAEDLKRLAPRRGSIKAFSIL
ncbi:hypothetical protein [Chrysiogenes arsenatis]|uniref:hypothetical protein n=1 Tax=Chrysiogenes arsenatis TaxID=309797 RepID=UPI0004066364|nr:hypothetical protein [Chrysiogenes arsenatis]